MCRTQSFSRKSPLPGRPLSRRSRLAGKEARKPCIALRDAFAGKPAPTTGGRTPTSVVAGLPANRPASPASLSETPSLASQRLHKPAPTSASRRRAAGWPGSGCSRPARCGSARRCRQWSSPCRW
ncbi:hypothetical protein EX349_07765 [Pseudomonas protegens]|nr:hypothetical protein [Pseudomonas protegens]NUE74387.1 hypothetical protein [Pseudomonas protegens]